MKRFAILDKVQVLSFAKKGANLFVDSLVEIKNIFLSAVKLDRFLLVLSIVYCIIVLPSVFSGVNDAKLLDLVGNDEPLITMQLDGMTVPPYGNPANYLKAENDKKVPSYWGDFRYFNIMYYGGTYLNLGFLIFAPLKMLGFKTLPTAPVILRSLSALFGLLTLLSLYNFAKRYVGLFPAIFSVLFLMIDYSFFSFSTRIHPDTLLYFLSFLSLSVGMRYVETNKLSALAALGIVIGLAQGAKSGGGFWIMPMAFLATYLGFKKTQLCSFFSWKEFGTFSKSFLIVLIFAILFFIISTPSAFLDSYYFKIMANAYKVLHAPTMISNTPVTAKTWLTDWLSSFSPAINILLFIALSVTLIQLAITRLKGSKSDIALLLCLTLAISNFLFYALLGAFWVQLFYLVPATGIIGLLIGRLFNQILHFFYKCKSFGVWGPRVVCGAVAAILLFYGDDSFHGILNTSNYYVDRINVMRSTNVAMGDWAEHHIPHSSKILYDGGAYFNPALFKNQIMGTAALRYSQIVQYEPDYISISNWQGNWITVLRGTQNLKRLDPIWNSVRLYQDLIDKNKNYKQVRASKIPYINLVHVESNNQEHLTVLQKIIYAFCPNFCGHPDLFHIRTVLLFKIEPDFYKTDNIKNIEKV